jgi:hypothetical protein
MGTTLTGTKPKDTYDSLIKVGDNGPISGTAKYLSDGLGNDLPIAVSTSNVGIGASAPTSPLTIQPANDAANTLRIYRGKDGGFEAQSAIIDAQSGNVNFKLLAADAVRYFSFQLSSNSGSSYTQAARIDLDGLKFGSDTAAANALDDYEEGTFTPTLAFGGTGISAYNAQKGFYTKIGNTVNFTLFIQVQQKGAGTGAVTVSLPLASVNTQDRSYSINVTGQSLSGLSGALFGYLVENSSSVQVFQTDATGGTALTDAVFNDFSTDNIIVTGTYQTA